MNPPYSPQVSKASLLQEEAAGWSEFPIGICQRPNPEMLIRRPGRRRGQKPNPILDERPYRLGSVCLTFDYRREKQRRSSVRVGGPSCLLIYRSERDALGWRLMRKGDKFKGGHALPEVWIVEQRWRISFVVASL